MLFAESKSRRIVVASRSRWLCKTSAKSQRVWGSMQTEIDHDLTPDQWETLKALRVPAAGCSTPNPFVLAELVALRLVAVSGNSPVITPAGRKALIRGSSRLWDVAA